MALFDKYDGFEIQPCYEHIVLNADGSRNKGESFVEVCEPKDAQFWTVYGHINGEGVEALCDCPTAEIADEIRDALLVMDYEGKYCLNKTHRRAV